MASIIFRIRYKLQSKIRRCIWNTLLLQIHNFFIHYFIEIMFLVKKWILYVLLFWVLIIFLGFKRIFNFQASFLQQIFNRRVFFIFAVDERLQVFLIDIEDINFSLFKTRASEKQRSLKRQAKQSPCFSKGGKKCCFLKYSLLMSFLELAGQVLLLNSSPHFSAC